MSMVPQTARQVAFRVIEQWKQDGRFAAGELERWFARLPELGRADRGLSRELVFGVIRRKATLGAVLRPQLKRPRQQVESRLWTLLELGAYQLVFLSPSAHHAAVHETVELARWLGRARWTGFANGVLRSLARDLPGEPAAGPAADAVPLGQGGYLRLGRPHLPDPGEDPVGYIATAASLPGWLAKRWFARFGFEELLRLSEWFNSPAPTWLRINPLAADAEAVTAALEADGKTEVIARDEAILGLAGTAHAPSLPGFAEGHFTVQDASASAAARLLAPRPGQLVLDLCAAPGTKSTQLAELMENRGRVVAADSHAERLAQIAPAARRLGLSIVKPLLVTETGDGLPDGPFDAALVDPPCSNTGVLGKRPEVRWRIERDEPDRLARLQRQLLAVAANRLAPLGRLVYSTCSIEPIENEQVVAGFLEGHEEFSLVEERHHVPGRPADGGYQALLVRGDPRPPTDRLSGGP